MSRIEVSVNVSGAASATRRFGERARALFAGALILSAAEAAAEVARAHFVGLNSERNRYGSNFYSRWATSSAYLSRVSEGGKSGTLTIKDEHGALRHKIRGGELRARVAKYLTIPISERAKFASARDEDGAIPGMFVRRAGGKLFLSTEDGGRIENHFVLKRSVMHSPRPEVVPPRDRLAKAAQKACEAFAEELARG